MTCSRGFDSDKKHIAWVNSFIALIDGLQKYVKQYHTTGLVWNPKVSLLPGIR